MKSKRKRQGNGTKRIIYPGAVYHLTQRAPGKEPLFLEEGDYLRMLALLKDTASRYDLDIFSFCLMTNHLHVLLRSKKENLSFAGKYMFESYAKFFNAKYRRKGPVFCRPFRTRICQDDSYFLTASVYIHLNPLKAGLSDDIFSYKWSTANLYLKNKEYNTFVKYKYILKMLDKEISSARKEYKRILDKVDKRKTGAAYFLNPEKFIREARIHAINFFYEKNSSWSIEEEIEKFKNFKRCPVKDRKAKKYLVEQLLANGYKISEIADLLKERRQGLYKSLHLS